MSIDKKLYQLRKEKNLSQEALAEQLNTTRQAISKWENGQGLPEIEKLISLAKIFGVSTDYLLQDNQNEVARDQSGLYVSKEQAQAWLWRESHSSKRIAIGLVFLFSAIVPFLLIKEAVVIRLIIAMLLGVIGLGSILAMCLSDRAYEYRPLKRNPLAFDPSYLGELAKRYTELKKKYIAAIVVSFSVILLGAIGFFTRSAFGNTFWIAYLVVYISLFSVSIGSLQYCFTMIGAYEMLVHNSEYSNKISTRFINKLFDKVNRMFR